MRSCFFKEAPPTGAASLKVPRCFEKLSPIVLVRFHFAYCSAHSLLLDGDILADTIRTWLLHNSGVSFGLAIVMAFGLGISEGSVFAVERR